MSDTFREKNTADLQHFIDQEALGLDPNNILRMDLHCHDLNSSEPDELWGRILRLPETWLGTDELVTNLRSKGCGPITITNHNNATSCWQLMDKGVDVLSGAEFTCTFPEWGIKIHVLAYGFTPEQETRLNRLRRDVYHFAGYCLEQGIPTVLPHPLFFYQAANKPPIELIEKYALLFSRFEVLNGQRDVWQNLLTLRWSQGLTEEKIDQLAKKHQINPLDFCENPHKKILTGGSDDHIGAFAGGTGSFLLVDDLAEQRKIKPLSQIALEAIKEGRLRPFGRAVEEERLHLALLDYFAQVANNIEDPGLLRLLLHRGELSDKLSCLALGNVMMELKRHKYTMKFFKMFHKAVQGKSPSYLTKRAVSKDYRPAVRWIDRLASARRTGGIVFEEELKVVLPGLFDSLQTLLVDRVKDHLGGTIDWPQMSQLGPDDLIQRFEAPSRLRSFLGGDPAQGKNMSEVHLGGLLDKLSFPSLAALVVCGSLLASSRSLYQNRDFLNQVAAHVGTTEHPKRVLWLTDTLGDKNGVSKVLESMLEQVQARDLPIDFLVCDGQLEEAPHLLVTAPVAQFDVPQFGDQKFRFPNLMEVHRIFQAGGYDQVVCSTEMLMGPVALFLKEAFKVPVHFYMHTDWLDFSKRSLGLDQQAQDRVRRMLRGLYSQFDGVFVLNEEHRQWLTSSQMELPEEKVKLTAHWVDDLFTPQAKPRPEVTAPRLMFAGRLSKEKGVLDLPVIDAQVKARFPDARFVIAGVGPEEAWLKQQMPDAEFVGWVEHQELPGLYAKADFLVLPSRFDTFGCVVLEALSCGVPVAAYDTKGPRDILSKGGGLLAEEPEALADAIIDALSKPGLMAVLQDQALSRAGEYRAEPIMDQLLVDLQLSVPEPLVKRFDEPHSLPLAV